MNNKLKTIASFISPQDNVIDIACDHAYLAIYLKKNKLAYEVSASDISKNALNNAFNNITKANLDIPLYLSDGFKNISNHGITTAIISGVGANTIINIVASAPNNIHKWIISSNNNYYQLRKYMLKHHLYLTKEVVIKEHNKFYPIMLFTPKFKHLTKIELKYGTSNNIEYYQYLLEKEQNILKNIPVYKIIIYLKHLKEIVILKHLIKEKTVVHFSN